MELTGRMESGAYYHNVVAWRKKVKLASASGRTLTRQSPLVMLALWKRDACQGCCARYNAGTIGLIG